MRVLIVTAGSRGDVVPYTGLGQGLAAAGHTVTIATHETFAALVRAAGLGFAPLPGDPRAELATEGGLGWQAAGHGPRANARLVSLIRPYAAQTAAAVSAALDDADVVLLAALTAMGWHEAVGRGLPSMGVYLQPLDPTAAFPSVLTGHPRSLGGPANRALASLVRWGITAPFMPTANAVRRGHGLPPQTPGALYRRLVRDEWPVLHGFSRHLVPRPPDWRPGLQVAGPWWPAPDLAWSPPRELDDFLADGPPPVLVTLGSMAAGQGERVTAVAVEVLRRAGLRGVVQAGWAGLGDPGAADPQAVPRPLADGVVSLGDVPHEWLLPRTAAVVHHGGAGTTHAGVRHGIPAVPVPLLVDQPFWADRLHRAGVATAPIPFARVAAGPLAAALREVTTTPAYAARARDLAALVAQEDGVGVAVRAVGLLG